MPTWEPAFHQGNKVKVKLNLPIYFSLKNDVLNEKAQNYEINWGSISTQYNLTQAELEKQLAKQLYVRDIYGNEKTVTELIFFVRAKKNIFGREQRRENH